MSQSGLTDADSQVHELVKEAGRLISIGDLEEGLSTLARFFDLDAKAQTHDAVKGCLEGAAEACRHASFNWYASFK